MMDSESTVGHPPFLDVRLSLKVFRAVAHLGLRLLRPSHPRILREHTEVVEARPLEGPVLLQRLRAVEDPLSFSALIPQLFSVSASFDSFVSRSLKL